MSVLSKFILALDVPTQEKAIALVEKFLPYIKIFKVGLELFCKEGPSIVKEIHNRGGKVFLDLKLHDIPNTVKGACQSLSSLDVFMLNVHCSGGVEMMKAAQEVTDKKTLLIGVTILTSLETSSDKVLHLASQAKDASLNGVVCSVLEVKTIKEKLGQDFITVTPGIRNIGHPEAKPKDPDDQKRTATFSEALESGTDYLVLGRSLLQLKDPIKFLSSQ